MIPDRPRRLSRGALAVALALLLALGSAAAASGAALSGTPVALTAGSLLDGVGDPVSEAGNLAGETLAEPSPEAAVEKAPDALGAVVDPAPDPASGVGSVAGEAAGTLKASLDALPDGLGGLGSRLPGNESAPLQGYTSGPPARDALTEAGKAVTGKVPDRVIAILTFYQAPGEAQFEALRQHGITGGIHFRHLPVVAVAVSGAQLEVLHGLPGIRSVALDRPLEMYLKESAPQTGATEVWNELGYTGKGVTVAILDTGIDGLHPDLKFGEKTVQNVKIGLGTGLLREEGLDVFLPPVWLEDQPQTDTTSAHGTHVAGIAGGTGQASGGTFRGIAPGARLVGLGAGDGLFVLWALEGFEWILAKQQRYGIRVVNNSWGTTGPFDPDDPINVATRLLHDRGIVVVFAAGNSGPAEDTLNPYSVAPWVIGVAAADKTGKLASFSSRGIPGDPLYRPTVTAPGVRTLSARSSTVGLTALGFLGGDAALPASQIPYYSHMSGTSMAAPHVAGVVALMLEANPRLTPSAVRSILMNTASPMATYAPWQVGGGLVNARAAVEEALTLDSTGKILGYRARPLGNSPPGDDEDEEVIHGSFTGTLGPSVTYLVGSQASHQIGVPEGSTRLRVRLTWASDLEDLDLSLVAPDGTTTDSQRFQILEGGASESVAVESPAQGVWTARVRGWTNLVTPYRLEYWIHRPRPAPPADGGVGDKPPVSGPPEPAPPGQQPPQPPPGPPPGGQTGPGPGAQPGPGGTAAGPGTPPAAGPPSGTAGARWPATDSERRNLVWREALARGLARAGTFLPVAGAGAGRFADVVGHWAHADIVLLAEIGIVRGYLEADGTYAFGADRSISRAELAVMVARVLDFVSPNWRPSARGAGPERPTFADLERHWAGDDVAVLRAHGLVAGYEVSPGQVRFGPDEPATRAQAAVMLARVLERLAIPAGPYHVGLTDINGHWARSAIEYLVSLGIVAGYPDGTYRPERQVTRAEFSALVMRAMAQSLVAREVARR